MAIENIEEAAPSRIAIVPHGQGQSLFFMVPIPIHFTKAEFGAILVTIIEENLKQG